MVRTAWNKGKHWDEDTKKKIGLKSLGRPAWNKGILKTSVFKPCAWCGQQFKSVKKHNTGLHTNFCSNYCRGKSRYEAKTIWLVCPTCKIDFRTTPGHISKGRKYCCKLCMNTNPDWLEGQRINSTGENSPVWRGGLTVITGGIRRSAEYTRARKIVLKRDIVCVSCGSAKCLEVDHILPVSTHKALIYDINNMRVLCHECHIKTDTYGVNTKLK